MNPGREGTGLQVLFWEPLSIWNCFHSCQQKFRNISSTIFLKVLLWVSLSFHILYFIQYWCISSSLALLLSWIHLLEFLCFLYKHLFLTTNKSGTYWDLVECWTLQDETSLFPLMGDGNCLPLPPTVHHLKSSLTASAFSTQTVSAYCCLCLHFLKWEEDSLQIPSELLHLQWL